MSNFHPTVGRNAQYTNKRGIVQAAIITSVNPVVLAVFEPYAMEGSNGIDYVTDAREFVIGARASENLNTYRLHWQNR